MSTENARTLNNNKLQSNVSVNSFHRTKFIRYDDSDTITPVIKVDSLSSEQLLQHKTNKGIKTDEWVYEDYGMKIDANFDTFLSKKYPWAIATPDGFFKGEDGKYGIEFKAPSIFNSSYGEPDTDDIPQHNLVQVHHSMAVLPRLKGYYLFTYTENGITRYVIKKDKEIEEKLMEKESRFKGFVDENVPPPPRNEQDLIYHYFKTTNKT